MRNIPNKSVLMNEIETKLGGDIEEILRSLYVDKNMSVDQIGRTLNLSYVTIRTWLRLAGIRSRMIKL